MRSAAERSKQLRNAVLASAISLIPAGIAAAILCLCLKLAPALVILISALIFVIALAVLLILWKKTDLIRCILYYLYKVRHPEGSRKYFCPCCNRSLSGFADMRYYDDTERFDPARFKKQRQDVICPFCYSAPRQRILSCWAEKNTDLLRRSEILYFAPEYSMMKWFRRNKIKVTTADLYDKRADLKLDITRIDLPDESYDMVIANHVLEHVSSYEAALSELRRILKPDGTMIVSFPIDPDLDTVKEQETGNAEERIRLFGQNDHVRVFGKDSEDIISSSGFSVSIIDVSDTPDPYLPVTGPADYDSNNIFICRRTET